LNSEAIENIYEMLDLIEGRLLSLEKTAEYDVDPHVAVQLLFRDLHNLKSSLSMQGEELCAMLIHQAESCLDALRSGKGDIHSDWVELLLDVIDGVKARIDGQEEFDSSELSGRLEGLLENWLHNKDAQTREINFPLEPDEALGVKNAVSAGLTLYTVEKIVSDAMTIESIQSLPVFDAIAEAGQKIACRLVRVPGSGSVVTVIFATEKTMDDLSLLLFDPFYPVTGSKSAETLPAKSKNDIQACKTKTVPLPADAKLKRILIVDDETVALMLLQYFLMPYGRIDTSQDGNDALDKFRQALGGDNRYDVIFLDIMIPGITGSGVLEEIRAQEQKAGIAPGHGVKIVMVSTISDYSLISASFQKQGDAYLVKPINGQVIDKTMVKLGFSKIVLPFLPEGGDAAPQ